MCIFVHVMMIKWCLKLTFYLYRFTVNSILHQVCTFTLIRAEITENISDRTEIESFRIKHATFNIS